MAAGSHGVVERRLPVSRATLGLAAWALLMFLLTVPNPIDGPPGWLDGSWQVGLDMASRQHLPMGSRLFFTYGPYGFLDFNVPYFAQQWLRAVGTDLAIHGGFLIALAILLRRVRAGWVVFVGVSVALVLGLPAIALPDVEAALLAAVLGMLAASATARSGELIPAALAGALIALLLMIKASGLIIAAGMLPILVGAALAGGRRIAAGALASSFVVWFGILWWGSGMGAADLPRWLHSSLDTTSGYSSAQYFGGLTVALFLAIATLLLFAGLAIAALLRRQRMAATWLLLCLLLDFAAFKEAFIRDGPVRDAIYYGEIAILAAVALAVVDAGRWLRAPRGRPGVAAGAIAAVLVLGVVQRLSLPFDASRITTSLRGWATVAHAAVSADARRNLEAPVRASAASNYASLIAAAQLPQGATVDAYGLDVGFFYADENVRWTPRPDLQSYQAYTPWLEQQDAIFYAGRDAPQYVIFRNLALDGRDAAFDEPTMMRVLMQRYRWVRDLDPQTVLLQRIDAPLTASEHPMGRACAPIGQRIAAPVATGRWLFGRLSMDFSLRGRAVDLGLKPAETRITLDTPAGNADYRFIWTVAQDGLFLSTRIDDAGGLRQAFSGTAGGNPITALTVATTAPWQWKTPVCVDFFTLDPPGASETRNP